MKYLFQLGVNIMPGMEKLLNFFLSHMPQKVTNATIAAKPTHARNVGHVVRIRTSNPKHEKATKTDTAPTTSQMP